ncbi:MAG: single-stranded-DNA-specific exonuclease RecJ, partial [Bacteroidales bacterium]|nr:single-stranded-DNA-specific exonuclease RecJ [Bacteroidales bacterium]
DIHAALEQCSDLLEHFGGHKCAAGVSLKPENLDKFIDRFEEVVQQTLPSEEMVPEIIIDAELSFSRHLNSKFFNILKQFAPFGPENTLPVFLSRGLVDTGYARVVGTNHLKFSPIQVDERSNSYPAIGFQLGENIGRVKAGERFAICYQLEENFWRGKTEIQLNTKDIRFEN